MTRPGGEMEGPFDQYDEHTFSASTEQVIAALAAGSKKLGAEVKATDASGKTKEFTVCSRIDTPNEVEYFKNGGILHYVLRQLAS